MGLDGVGVGWMRGRVSNVGFLVLVMVMSELLEGFDSMCVWRGC